MDDDHTYIFLFCINRNKYTCFQTYEYKIFYIIFTKYFSSVYLMVFIVGRLVYEIGVVILFLVIYAHLMTGTRFLQLRFPAELHTVKHKK